ncbi:MAG: cell division protein ZapA [Bacteroidota bacterium]
MKQSLININVMLAERLYPLSVDPNEEATIRQAAKMINEKIKSYQQLYAAKDKQDFLAMIALNLGVDNLKEASQEVSSTEITGDSASLRELNTLLDAAFELG